MNGKEGVDSRRKLRSGAPAAAAPVWAGGNVKGTVTKARNVCQK
jgi:hypothetical protein